MAREKVDCSGCDNYIEIWGRSRKEVDRKANWLRGQNPLCSACRTKEYEKKAAECAVEAAEKGWLELTGSEKQILFANKIRKEKMDLLDEKEHSFVIGSVKTMIKNAFSLETDEHVEYVKALIIQVLLSKTEARFWIDVSDYSVQSLIGTLKNDVLNAEMDSRKTDEEKAELKQLEEELIAEETIRPQEIYSNDVAHIIIDEERQLVKAKFPYDHKFINAVKELNYTWNSVVWQKKLAEYDANISDVAAETMSALYEKGFIVRCSDSDVRDKVIKGTWKPIEQRQAYLLKEGKHKGKIRFIRFDDFRLNANFKNIKGSSRYFGTDRIETYVVSPSNYAEILDFCDIHSFKLTQEAIKALDQAKAQFEKIPVVAIKKVEQEKIEEKQQEFVEITGIDESLADV